MTKPFESKYTSNDRKLSTCYSERKYLNPMSFHRQYTNVIIFEAKEASMKNQHNNENNIKNSTFRRRHQHSRQTCSVNSNNLYLTENTDSIRKTTIDSDRKSFPRNEILLNVKNTEYLLAIQERQRLKKAEAENQLNVSGLDKKSISILRANHGSVKDYLNKTRDLLLMKVSMNNKKERAIRITETYDNEIEKVNEALSKLNEAKTEFENGCVQTINEYVKLIEGKKDKERVKDNMLIEKIMQLRKDIQGLEHYKRELETEKINITRWIYLQIQIKEKKMELPMYYKTIIEESQQQQYRHSIMSMMKKTSGRKKSFKSAVQVELLNTPIEERERLLQYKRKLIFNSPEDINEELEKMKFKSLNLLKKYNVNTEEIDAMKKEMNRVSLDYIKNNQAVNQEIQFKEKELFQIKLITDQYQFQKKRNDDDFESKILLQKAKNKRALSYDSKAALNTQKNHTVNAKIKIMYDALRQMFSLDEENNIACLDKPIIKTKSNEIIDMLYFIEKSMIKLINQYNRLMEGPLSMKVQDIQNKIEKSKKYQKTFQQRADQNLKLEELKKKIEERNNKIYFLPKKKIDLNWYNKEKNEKQKMVERKKEKSDFGFQDLMYDLPIDDN